MGIITIIGAAWAIGTGAIWIGGASELWRTRHVYKAFPGDLYADMAFYFAAGVLWLPVLTIATFAFLVVSAIKKAVTGEWLSPPWG